MAGIQAFAAGAILTMLASTTIPETHEEGGPMVGIVITVGFPIALVLSRAGWNRQTGGRGSPPAARLA